MGEWAAERAYNKINETILHCFIGEMNNQNSSTVKLNFVSMTSN